MDRFIGPIQPPTSVAPVSRWAGAKQERSHFHLNPDAEPQERESEAEEIHPSTDLPVGHARFDEAGRRIDYTA